MFSWTISCVRMELICSVSEILFASIIRVYMLSDTATQVVTCHINHVICTYPVADFVKFSLENRTLGHDITSGRYGNLCAFKKSKFL